MSNSSKSRSVVDFDSEDALRKALMAVRLPDDSGDVSLEESNNNNNIDEDNDIDEAADGSNRDTTTGGGGGAKGGGQINNNQNSKRSKNDEDDTNMPADSDNLDWVLPSFDPETTEAQSMREELHRLTVLKNYLILDADREEVFDRLTGLASRFYNVPIALISLVDLGRQWFLSNRGLGDVRETPRRHAFCAHAILNKHNILIVPDATKDFRFKDNPLVTGPPNIRFYAGAVSVEKTMNALPKRQAFILLIFWSIDSHVLFLACVSIRGVAALIAGRLQIGHLLYY